jgi:uncharacterized protein (TIGR00251 family)
MSTEPLFTAEGDRIRIAVRLTPRARRDEACGLVDCGDGRKALSIRLAAPPVEGAANRALIAFLSAQLGVPKTAIAIASGDKSRLKIVEVVGADPERVRSLLV